MVNGFLPKKPNDYKVIDPFNRRRVCSYILGGTEDVNDAVNAATKAFETWAFSTKEERLKYLEALYEVYKKRWADMAKLFLLKWEHLLIFQHSYKQELVQVI